MTSITCSLDTMIREKRSAPVKDDIGRGLREAIVTTQGKIDLAFSDSGRFTAKFRDRSVTP